MPHPSDEQIKEWLVDEQQELLDARAPNCCPFCKDIDDVTWTEFEIALGDKFYFNTQDKSRHKIGASIVVFCTRCDEEIRAEDIK